MARPAVDLRGQRFGTVTILRRAGSSADGRAVWLARCDCGAEIVKPSIQFRRARTRDPINCGCLAKVKTTKRCSGCRTDKPRTDFGRDTRRKTDGLKSRCRRCEARDQRTFKQQHPDRATATFKRWYEKHKDRERASARERSARDYAAQPRRRLDRQRDDRAQHPERRRAILATFARRHPGRLQELSKQNGGKRRALQLGATVGPPINYERIKQRDQMVCHICRTTVAAKDLQFDHVIPLARGGEHSERNLAVSHARCNQRKNARVLTLF